MEEKLPDSFVPNRSLKEYPTEIGSQKFSPDNIDLFKFEKTSKIKKYYTQKFEELSKQYESLLNDIQVNELLYSAKYNFEPVVGECYYLYHKDDHKFLSLIEPQEWNNKYSFIGEFQYQTDGRWIKIQ